MIDTCLIGREQLLELVESTWSALVGTPIALAEAGDEGAFEPAGLQLTACVQITGAWRGAVLLTPALQLAEQAAGRMLHAHQEDLSSSDVLDAVAELCNIIGGGIKSLLPGPSSLSLPLVLHASSADIRMPMAQPIAHLRFAANGQPIELMILEETAVAANAFSHP